MHPRPAAGRSPWLVIAAALGVGAYAFGFNGQYPITEWLLVRVLGYWLLALYWAGGCLALGLSILERITPRQYRASEAPFVAFPLGVLGFAMATFVVSLGGVLGRPFFFLAPLVLMGIGFSASKRFVARLRENAVFRARPVTRFELLACAFGAVGLLLVYAPILTPHNLQHDARWYHLPIAQQYVAEGGLARFPEGWFLAAYPHLSSLLYAWALLLPATVVHRLGLAAHLEFVIFLSTVASIPAVVRRLVPGMRVPSAWAGFFLFPGFLVYDATVSLGADHVAALWAPAGLLALLATLRTSSPRQAVLVGMLAGGAAWTKYSALSVALPLLGAVLVSALLTTSRNERRSGVVVAAMLVSFGVCWSPHWLKNWVLYGNPVYPYAGGHFHPHPWNAETSTYVRVFLRNAVLAPAPGLRGVLDSIRAALTVGFDVNEYGFHGGIPTFGFLFAATSYTLPWLRPGRRVLLAYGLGFSAVVIWYWTNHRDRYLQACLPWLVAATVAVLALSWRKRGFPGKLTASLLFVSQLAFGAGVFLIPAHQMSPGGHPLPHLIESARQVVDKRYEDRFAPHAEWGFADWTALGKLLPPRSRVLVHEDRLWVGLDAPVVVDESGWQGGIRYSAFDTAAEVFDVLTSNRVTHIVTGINHADGGDHGIGGNLVFWEFVSRSATRIAQHGKLTLWRMPIARPEPAALGDVLVLSCNLSRPLGLYAFTHVQRRQPELELHKFAEATSELYARATYIVFEDGCEGPLDEGVKEELQVMTIRGKVTFYRRVRPEVAGGPTPSAGRP